MCNGHVNPLSRLYRDRFLNVFVRTQTLIDSFEGHKGREYINWELYCRVQCMWKGLIRVRVDFYNHPDQIDRRKRIQSLVGVYYVNHPGNTGVLVYGKRVKRTNCAGDLAGDVRRSQPDSLTQGLL